ncbi:MAG: histone H1 protein [Gammaproteobacteria bacterium]|nr:histone H1 protein [Gammaproteobacteria bacterium]
MKKLETKLAAGVRQAKKTQEQPAMAPASTPAAAPQAKRQSDQPSAPVRDDTRQNLHPERVWPD